MVQTFVKRLRFVLNTFRSSSKPIAFCGRVLSALRTDIGGEYFSNRYRSNLEQFGIDHQKTMPYNHHRNGLAERYMCTLMDIFRSMLAHKNAVW